MSENDSVVARRALFGTVGGAATLAALGSGIGPAAAVESAGTEASATNEEVAGYVRNPGETRDALEQAFVSVGDLVLSVYDFGAVNSASVSSQASLDSAMVAAVAAVAVGHRVTIKIPYGRVLGNFTVAGRYINFEGPGTLLGSITYQSATPNQLLRFYSRVDGLTIRSLTPQAMDGIRVIGGAFIEVTGCTFWECDAGIHADTWPGLAGQQNKTLNVHDNQFVDVNYGFKSTHRPGATWDATADTIFASNIIRLALISGVHVPGADGFVVDGNVVFHVGWQDSNTNLKTLKSDSVFFGTNSNYVQIIDNKLFESGACGVRLQFPQNVTVSGNQIIWAGQRTPESAIKISTSNAMTYAPRIVIAANLIDGPSLHGIHILGTGKIEGITIDNSNAIMLYKTRNGSSTYYGTEALPAGKYRVLIDGTPTGNARLALTEDNGSRQGILNVRGIISHARLQTSQREAHVHTRVSAAIAASSPRDIVHLRGQDGSASYMAGVLEVSVENDADPSRIAFYTLEVGSGGVTKTSGTGRNVEGMVNGNSNPAFTFAKVGSGPYSCTLAATPIGGTAGSFTFNIGSRGAILIGMLASDADALPLNHQ